MHVIVAGWLFAVAMLAVGQGSWPAGIAVFAALGLGPVAVAVGVAVLRRRGRADE